MSRAIAPVGTAEASAPPDTRPGPDPAPPAAGPPPPERGRPTAGQPSWPARLARRAGTAGRLASLQAVVLA
ncbi:MAG TPA: hypothetical protein VFN68_13380, partial [Acidimicrobiales bacterium]|nr:hypothetical protein [Acidimicrobiales bacterium]